MLVDVDQLATRTMSGRPVGVLVGQHLGHQFLTPILPTSVIAVLVSVDPKQRRCCARDGRPAGHINGR
jgi:hypothetical protein